MSRQPSARAVAIDAALVAQVRTSRVADHQIANLLAEMDRDQLHREFGYANLVDYGVDRHGLKPSRIEGLRRIGQRLPELPALNQTMANAEIDWTKARTVASVATPETETAWVALAKTTTVRVMEAAIRQQTPDGFPPSHVEEDDDELVRVTFRMSRSEAEMVRTRLRLQRAACGPETEGVEDGAILAMLLQRLLADVDPEAAPTPDRSRFVMVNQGTEDIVVGEAGCDAEVIEMAHGPERGHSSHTIPPATRRAVLHRDQRRCRVPGCSNQLWLDLHHIHWRSLGGSHVEGNLATVCGIHHRLLHDGWLEVAAAGTGLWFTFPSGRRVFSDIVQREMPLASGSVRIGNDATVLGRQSDAHNAIGRDHQHRPCIHALWSGEEPEDQAGRCTVGGDLDGDGSEDFFVGAHPAADSRGRGYVVTRPSGGPLSEAYLVLHGTDELDWFGLDGAIGDFDGDGASDLAAGIPRNVYFGFDRPGRVALFFGPLAPGAGAADDADLVIRGSDEPDAFGANLIAADTDGDRDHELIVAATHDSATREMAGAVYLFDLSRP